MDSLLILLVLFWIVKAVVKKGKRAGGNGRSEKQPHTGTPTAAAYRAKRAARMQEELQRRQQKRAAEAVRAQPEPKQITMAEAMGEGFSAYRPMERRMAQASGHADYEGSLGGGSTEGIDTCDPSLEHDRWQPAADSVYADEIGGEPLIDISPRAVMNGIVMSEILTRPAQRRRR